MAVISRGGFKENWYAVCYTTLLHRKGEMCRIARRWHMETRILQDIHRLDLSYIRTFTVHKINSE
jgi:hypothetical protein